MVQFKTIVDNRFPKRKIKMIDRVVTALSLVAETGFNTMLPFAFGFYFAKTQNFLFLLGFFINILFHIKIKKKQAGYEIRITRGI